MIKIEVNSPLVDTKQGTSSKTGKQYSIREQEAWGYFFDMQGQPHPHPMRVRLTLDDTQQPYAPGVYTLAPESFYVDRFGQISIRARLKPADAKSIRAAA